MRDWLESVLWIIYPARCRCCRAPLGWSRVPYLCDTCWAQIAWTDPPYCQQCGIALPTHLPSGILCASCQRALPAFMSRSLGRYEGALREAIHLLKYERKRALVPHLVRVLQERQALLDDLRPVDVVVPVPLHKRRYRKRGFNQAEILAREVARILGVPLVATALARVRDTIPQSSLTHPAERQRNIRGAFQVVDHEALKCKRVLLVDDIHTTGATTREAARRIQRAKASEVKIFTLARA